MLLKKSQENIEAADVLHKTKHYNSAAHSAYYSCFQLMVHINPTSRLYKTGMSSHEKVINFFKKDITEKRRTLSYDFFKNITKIKKAREEADYSDCFEIGVTRSEDTINAAIDVTKVLKSVYSL